MIDFQYFEYIVLYNALFNPSYISSIVDHNKSYFWENSDVRTVLDKIIDFYKRRNVLPNVSELKVLLSSESERKALVNALTFFKTMDKTYNQDELLANTEKFFREKSVYKGVVDIADRLSKKDKINPEEILEYFQSACTISLVDNLGFDYFNNIDQHCKDITQLQSTISTGWKWLDEKLGGGFLTEGRALYLFSGFTNVGKSIFLGNVANNVLKQNKTVVIFSLEMSETIYAKRHSSQLTQIPFGDLAKRSDDLKATILSFKDTYPNARLILKEYSPKSISVNALAAFLKKLGQKGIVPDLIVVDYLSLLKSANKDVGLYEEGKAVTEQLRALSYMFKRPILSAVQLGRGAANTENPGVEKVSESIGVGFTVDAQFGIWATEESKSVGLIHMGVQKNRFGPNFGTTTFKIDFNTLTISEVQDTFIMDTNEIAKSSTENTLAQFGEKFGS